MTRPRMGSLRAQLVILILGALAIAQAVSLWLFADERSADAAATASEGGGGLCWRGAVALLRLP